MKLYYPLNLPVNKFVADSFKFPDYYNRDINPYIKIDPEFFNIPKYKRPPLKWIYKDEDSVLKDILHTDFIDFIEQTPFAGVSAVWIFYAVPKSTPLPIHADWGTDLSRRNFNFAINCTFESTDHKMFWYRPKRSELNSQGWPIDAINNNNSPIWERDAVEEIASHTLNGLTLLRTDIPHNTENYSTDSRWCVSVRVKHNPNSWEDTVEILKDWYP